MLPISPIWGWVISGVVFFFIAILIIGAVVFFGSLLLSKAEDIGNEYMDGAFKAMVTASVAISLFYVCLYLYEPIKAITPLNILTVWLLTAIVGAFIVNAGEIIGGFRKT
jgi:uncharacterized membrane protein YGL010W